uniref:Uncharacterized protein n=1 Tax=Saccharum spontaneum TaxID=62335 RepID=A0A678T4K2_SACSP|nr:hypothetical protein SS04J15_000005 [Saccharum spontaneum]
MVFKSSSHSKCMQLASSIQWRSTCTRTERALWSIPLSNSMRAVAVYQLLMLSFGRVLSRMLSPGAQLYQDMHGKPSQGVFCLVLRNEASQQLPAAARGGVAEAGEERHGGREVGCRGIAREERGMLEPGDALDSHANAGGGAMATR